MHQRPRNKRFIHISSALDKTLAPFQSRYGGGEFKEIWRLWTGIVGPEIAKNARPESFKNGCLTVTVANSAWMQHLQFLKNDMADRINDACGTAIVQEIRLRIGAL